MTTEPVIPGYTATERTRYRAIVPSVYGGRPRWTSPPTASLTALQRAYIAGRKASGEGASTFASADVYDEMGQQVARISYNGRLWPAGEWASWSKHIADAPAD